MKKRIMFIISLGYICFFSACSKAEDAENLFEMSSLQEQENLELSLETPTERSLDEGIEYAIDDTTEFTLTEKYQYGNMQKNVPSGNFMRYEDKIMFLYYNDQTHTFNLYEMDLETGEIRLFCKDATCMHDTMKCASGGAVSNLEQYDEKLYAMSGGGQIMELIDGKFEQIVDGAVSYFWHAQHNLYAVSKDGSLVVFENGKGKSRVLIDEYIDYWNVTFGLYLYGCTSKGITRVDLSAETPQAEIVVQSGHSMIDGEHIYYFDDKTFCLYRCDMDGSNPVQLTDQPVLPASINFDDDYLYFRLFTNLEMDGEGCHDIYRLQKNDPQGIEKIAELPDIAYTIYTVPGYDRLIVKTAETHDAGAKEGLYTVAKDGSSVEKLEVPEF